MTLGTDNGTIILLGAHVAFSTVYTLQLPLTVRSHTHAALGCAGMRRDGMGWAALVTQCISVQRSHMSYQRSPSHPIPACVCECTFSVKCEVLYHYKKHLKNVGPIRHCEPPHAACSNFTLPFTRCRYCRHHYQDEHYSIASRGKDETNRCNETESR